MPNVLATNQGNLSLRSLENPVLPLSGANLVRELGLNRESYTGRRVSPNSALINQITVYACVTLLAESIGTLPHKTYRYTKNGPEQVDPSSKRSWQERVARMLERTPNPEMTAQELWQLIVGHGALWGNAYMQIVRAGDGHPSELWPLRPDKMAVYRKQDSGPRFYRYQLASGEHKELPASEVMHVRWFGTDGLVGMSPIEAARNQIAEAQAGAEYGGRFFANSAIPGGLITTDGSMTAEMRAAMHQEWDAQVGGLSKAQRVAVLSGGLKFQAMGIPPKDAQFLELRQYGVSELARVWRVPGHMIGDSAPDKSWASGLATMTEGFHTFTLQPITERIEQAVSHNLGLEAGITTLDDEGIFTEFDAGRFLRGDSTTRWANHEIAARIRVASPANIAAAENMVYDPERPTGYDNPYTIPGSVAPNNAEPLVAPGKSGYLPAGPAPVQQKPLAASLNGKGT